MLHLPDLAVAVSCRLWVSLTIFSLCILLTVDSIDDFISSAFLTCSWAAPTLDNTFTFQTLCNNHSANLTKRQKQSNHVMGTILLITRISILLFSNFMSYKTWNINYCVRGGHKPARWPWPTSRLTEMEKWSWIHIWNPISTKIELVLEVHPLLPPTKFGGDPWTCSWDILRTNRVCTDTQTDTRQWPQDLAAYGAQVIRAYGRRLASCWTNKRWKIKHRQ